MERLIDVSLSDDQNHDNHADKVYKNIKDITSSIGKKPQRLIFFMIEIRIECIKSNRVKHLVIFQWRSRPNDPMGLLLAMTS